MHLFSTNNKLKQCKVGFRIFVESYYNTKGVKPLITLYEMQGKETSRHYNSNGVELYTTESIIDKVD